MAFGFPKKVQRFSNAAVYSNQPIEGPIQQSFLLFPSSRLDFWRAHGGQTLWWPCYHG